MPARQRGLEPAEPADAQARLRRIIEPEPGDELFRKAAPARLQGAIELAPPSFARRRRRLVGEIGNDHARLVADHRPLDHHGFSEQPRLHCDPVGARAIAPAVLGHLDQGKIEG